MSTLKTNSQIFADRGDPWMTDAERQRNQPLKHPPMTEVQKEFHLIRERLRKKGLLTKKSDKEPGQPLFVVSPEENPSVDMYTLASRADTKDKGSHYKQSIITAATAQVPESRRSSLYRSLVKARYKK